MPRLRVNGVCLNVEILGEGPPVVALHGFTGDLSTWERFAEVAREEFKIVLVDLLGHGASDAPENGGRYSMECCVEDLVGVLKALEMEKASWLGYSMGGRVCLYLALAAPERCRALVLEEASPGILDRDERSGRVERDEKLARMIDEKGVEAFVEYWEALPLFASRDRLPEKVRGRLRRQRLRNNPVGLANSLRGMGAGAQPPLQGRLPDLSSPTLFVVGQEDGRFCHIARTMSTAVPQAGVAAIPEAGHAPHLEQPERFNEVVLDFLRRHGSD